MTQPPALEAQLRGGRARAWREGKGLSRRALSVLLGYSARSIEDFERGFRVETPVNGAAISEMAWKRYRLLCTGLDAVFRSSDAMPF